MGLALVGKLLTNSSFNIDAMKSVLKDPWKPLKGPWAFDTHLLLLREIPGKEQPKDLVFFTSNFWIKVYNVLFVRGTKSLVEIVGNKLGKFLEFDESDLSGWLQNMRN
ncbi:DNA-directed RNA polymerase II subunit RPB2 [Bienertia sinuspersici]